MYDPWKYERQLKKRIEELEERVEQLEREPINRAKALVNYIEPFMTDDIDS